MAHTASDNRTDLMDSLLHTDVPRMILGVICGVAAGALMLGLTMIFPPTGMHRMWWIQLVATIFFGGQAMDYAVTKSVLIAGLGMHFFLCCVCGFIMGKMTTSKDTFKLAVYGLVLGGLCWLATNMFGPNFMEWVALKDIGQWYRGFIYAIFGASLGVFLSIASRALPNN